MKKFMLVIGLAMIAQGCSMESSEQSASSKSADLKAPIAKKVPHKMQIHGDERIDDYYWMRDDSRQDAEIIAHLQAEEDFAQQQLAHTQALQDTLYKEMTERLKKDDSSVPVLRNGYYYQSKFVPDNEYQLHVRLKDEKGAVEEVLLDGNALGKGQDYFDIGNMKVSSNNQILAYSEDLLSRRIYTVKFKDLTSGKLFSDELTGTNGQVIWANDSKTVFYVVKDPQTLLGYKVMRHTLGTAQADDVLMYEETDNTFYTYIGKSLDDQYVAIYHSNSISTGMSILDANDASASFAKVHALAKDFEYSVQPHGDDFYILTNHNAQNFKIAKASAANVADNGKWQDVIAHDESTLITHMLVLKDSLLYTQRSNGLVSLKVLNFASGQVSTVGFDEQLFSVYMTSNVDFNASKVRVAYESMTTPASVYDIDLTSFAKTLLKQDEVIGGYDPKAYQSKRLMLLARDGVKVPVSVLYRKDLFKQDGSNPLLQSGYGSYGSTTDPYFSSSLLSLVDRGFVYARAHIRGSEMLGRSWYEDGKLLNKINSFNDFVDVTKVLVADNYGAKDKVFALGGSAGGLLMGAIINQAPELYLGVVAAVPFVDVVTTMLDESIPLTTNEFDEWGNPKQKQYYDYMLSYSPYDNVEAKDYPNLLVTSGLHDSQVQYFEPAKWVAKLREMKTDNNQLLFHVNMEAGHGGASGRYRRYKDRAFIYAFYLDLLER